MGKVIKVICFVFFLSLFTTVIASFLKEYVHDYNIFKTEDHPAIVTEKFAKKSLTGMPKYYVAVDLNDADALGCIHNRVFSWQFKQLEVGDSIKGFYIHGNHFFTALDVVLNSFNLLLVLMLPTLIIIGLLSWLLIVYLDRKEEKRKKPYRPKKHNKRKIIRHYEEEPSLLEKIFPKFLHPYISPIIWFVAVSTIFIFTIGFVVNGVGKIAPFGKTASQGIVIDREYTKFSSREAPIITLTIQFEDDNQEEVTVIKDVNPKIYDQHAIGDLVKISYPNYNPYHIYIRDVSFSDNIGTVFSLNNVFPLILLLGLLIVVLLKLKISRSS